LKTIKNTSGRICRKGEAQGGSQPERKGRRRSEKKCTKIRGSKSCETRKKRRGSGLRQRPSSGRPGGGGEAPESRTGSIQGSKQGRTKGVRYQKSIADRESQTKLRGGVVRTNLLGGQQLRSGARGGDRKMQHTIKTREHGSWGGGPVIVGMHHKA